MSFFQAILIFEPHLRSLPAAIDANLKKLAERRTDIFGVGEEAVKQAGVGRKFEDERREDKGSGSNGRWKDGENSYDMSGAQTSSAWARRP